MLTEERRNKIVELVNLKKSVNVQELIPLYTASESTIRRDLTELAAKGLLTKVHGGAIALTETDNIRTITNDSEVNERENSNRDEKILIARYAANLIQNNDMIYIDAGTSTGFITNFIPDNLSTTFVTNGLMHARALASKGFKVYIPGGLCKPTTEAVIGEEAILTLSKYHFTKGFFGTNAINTISGFSTPDSAEAMIKKTAMQHCSKNYVLSDSSKFDSDSYVTFANYEDAIIISTDKIPALYKSEKNVIIAGT